LEEFGNLNEHEKQITNGQELFPGKFSSLDEGKIGGKLCVSV